MPVTLAQAKLNVVDKVDTNIIDEFQKSNDILNRLTFDDVVSPAGGGSTLTYGYTRQISQRGGAFRAINAEYTPVEVTKARYTVELKPLGGSFQIDRVLAGMAAGREVAFQLRELIKGTQATFSDAVINGDSAVDANSFDGLNKSLAGSTTEYLPLNNGATTGYVDWTTIDTQAKAIAAIEAVDATLALMDGAPDVIYGNGKALARFKRIAAMSGLLDTTKDQWDRPVSQYNGIPFVDLGTKGGSNLDIIPIRSGDPDGAGAGGTITGLSDLYFVRFGLDAFHGVSVNGPLVRSWLPDFTTSGAVKTGEAEMGPAAVVLKATKAAAVLRNVKVA